MTFSNLLQSNIERLENRWHLAATVNVSSYEPIALRESRQPGIFVVTRRDSLQEDLTVPLIVRGTARNGVDYGRIGREVTIPAGQRSVAIPVRAANNTTVSRYVTLAVDTPEGYRSSSNAGVVYVVSNDDSYLPSVQSIDFLYPLNLGSASGATVGTGGATTGGTTTGGTPAGGTTGTNGTVIVTSPGGQVSTIPTGSAIPIGGIPGDVTPSPATGVGTGTVTTTTFDPLTGLPITNTSAVGGNAVPFPSGTAGTGTATVTTIDPATGLPVTSTTGTGTSGTTTGIGGTTGAGTGVSTGTAIGTGTVAGGIFGTSNDGLTIGTTTGTSSSPIRQTISPVGIYTGSQPTGTSFGTTPISSSMRAGVSSDSLFIS